MRTSRQLTATNKRVYNNLCDKLHPSRVVGCSDKMYFIISTILGQEWVTCDSSYGEFSITSDVTLPTLRKNFPGLHKCLY